MTEGLPEWLAFFAVMGLIDWWLDGDGVSLSKVTRRTFHTDTLPGKLTFTAAFTTGAVVLHRHIVKGKLCQPSRLPR